MPKNLLCLPYLGRQVVFAREQVAVWPSSRQRIPGRLSLVKQCGVVFLTWLPSGAGRSGTATARPSPATGEGMFLYLPAFVSPGGKLGNSGSSSFAVALQETGADHHSSAVLPATDVPVPCINAILH